MTKQTEPPVVEFSQIPEVFADGFSCISIANGVAKLPFFSVVQFDQSHAPTRRLVARLAVPLPVLAGMHQAIGQVLDQLKEQGAIMEQQK